MKQILRILFVVFLVNTSQLNAQCIAGYTQASLNWDYLDYLIYTGNYTSSQGYLSSNAEARTQHFVFGTQRLTITHNFADAASLGENITHTGETGSFGTGADISFNGNGTITFSFENEVRDFKVSTYDLDASQSLTVTARNAANVAQNITMAKANLGALHVITGSGTTSASATSSLVGSIANNSNNGTINITVAGPVKTITLTFAGTSGDFWLSDALACSAGSFPTNYYNISRPFTGQSEYVLHAFDKSVYMLNPSTGVTTFIFEDAAGLGTINSMAYDPYNHILYYVYSLTGTGSTRLMKYDFETEAISIVLNDLGTIGIPSIDANGSESGAGAFYNGSLYLGIETSNSGRTSGREAVIWRVDFDGSNVPYRASQLFAVPIDGNLGGDNCLLHDWADFVINDGILYNFDAAENDRSGVSSIYRNQSDIYHINMMTGDLLNQYVAPGAAASPTWYPGQPSVGWDGTVYTLYANGGSPSTAQGMPMALPYIASYDQAGNIGSKISLTSNPMFTPASPSLGDAAEAYKPKADFGDAPASYDPDALAPAVHEYNPLLTLGGSFDNEWVTRGQSLLANADNHDDCLPFVTAFYPSLSSYLTEITVFNNTGGNATVGAWLDFDGDGVFESSEGITVTVGSDASPQNVWLFWPNGTGSLPVGSFTYLRIRITTGVMSTSNATGYYSDGEVEDYRVPANSLPLNSQYINFNAQKTAGKRVLLKWNAQNEIDNSVYGIERSEDQVNWTSINYMYASGKSDYNFTDSTPITGTSYYRLRTMQPDGVIKYSQSKRIDLPITSAISLSPNPNKGNFKLSIYSETKTAGSLSLLDMSGRVIFTKNILMDRGVNTVPIELNSRLTNGIYSIQLKIDQKIYNEKLVINH